MELKSMAFVWFAGAKVGKLFNLWETKNMKSEEICLKKGGFLRVVSI